MKILIVLLVGVAFAKAQECTPLRDNNFETLKCTVADGDQVNVVERDNCTEPTCCEYEGECVVADTGVTRAPPSGENDPNSFVNAAFEEVPAVVDGANAELDATMRSLGYPPIPGLAPTCYPPVPFPANCKISRHAPYVLEPPVSVPYCLRIPCRPNGNGMYDKSLKMCGSQPGCYFDKELYELREAFKQSVLPNVPVCHLAIRNKFFQQKSRAVVQKYGSWNPYFTNCLLTQFDQEIRKGPEGCELLPILDAFYITAKMAGWSTINSYSCALIGACFRKGRGCFYPVDISKVRVKSGQREIIFQKNEIVYGRPKCQPFDTSSALTILKSYHRCLSCGCTVDSSITILYYNHLFSLGNKLTSENHWKYWGDVERGHVGAFNIESVLSEYGPTSPTSPQQTASKPTPPPTFSTDDPFGGDLFPLPGGVGGQGPPFVPMSNGAFPQFPFPTPSQQGPGCGFAFRQYGGRPCEPPKFSIGKHNKYCPYKPFHVPRFDPLKGSFEGCCDLNLCYLPKSEISKMHSGPSMYYSEWSLYSACSASCGKGEQKRYRRCVSQDRKLCTEKLEDTKPCFTQCSSWTPWSSYSPCARSCFPGGIRTRKRQCLPKGGFCPGVDEQTLPCNTHTCSIWG